MFLTGFVKKTHLEIFNVFMKVYVNHWNIWRTSWQCSWPWESHLNDLCFCLELTVMLFGWMLWALPISSGMSNIELPKREANKTKPPTLLKKGSLGFYIEHFLLRVKVKLYLQQVSFVWILSKLLFKIKDESGLFAKFETFTSFNCGIF